jgi:pimeloyl-ACP methyl ester carboxylesterase
LQARPRRSKAVRTTPKAPAMTRTQAAERAPSALLMMLEGRMFLEGGATLAALPWLRRAPEGDGHPVLVLPGLGANDLSTIPLRNYLRERGYAPHPWNYGFNFGPRHGVLRGCVEHARELHERYGQRLSLIGWSLGGIYAREIAKFAPDITRCVITLGTPFNGHPRATNAWRFYEMVSGQKTDDPALRAQIAQAPPVPTTSIYSRSDGVVAWQCSINEPGPLVENIEIQASHMGMGMHPAALYAIADRLAQPEGRWRRFEADGARRWFYRTEGTSD